MAETSDNSTPAADEQSICNANVRTLIFYLLYAAESFDYQISLDSIVDNFNRGFDCSIKPDGFVVRTTHAVIENRDALDQIIIPLLENWRIERIGLATKLILRLAFWEMEHTDTEPKIVINEAIELAKTFCELESYRFVNGVLDRALKQRQAAEAQVGG